MSESEQEKLSWAEYRELQSYDEAEASRRFQAGEVELPSGAVGKAIRQSLAEERRLAESTLAGQLRSGFASASVEGLPFAQRQREERAREQGAAGEGEE